MNIESLYEQTLVIRSQIGDTEAFAELFSIYNPRMAVFVERMIRGLPDQAVDFLQEIWVLIFRQLPRLREPALFRSWAFRIARDRIFREYRKRRLNLISLHEIDDPSIQASDISFNWDEKERMDECLTALSVEHREVLLLRFFEELSYEEIGHITGVTVGTVRSRIHYAKQALKKRWQGKII
jgi:RNA polymerase sigma-70 factor (ECF subfamily)